MGSSVSSQAWSRVWTQRPPRLGEKFGGVGGGEGETRNEIGGGGMIRDEIWRGERGERGRYEMVWWGGGRGGREREG